MTLTAEKIEQVRKRLEALPEAEKAARPLTKRAMVEQLAAQLEDGQRRGYTLKELAEVLAQDGVQIHPGMLGQYLRAARKEREKSGSRKRPDKGHHVIPIAKRPEAGRNARREEQSEDKKADAGSNLPKHQKKAGGKEPSQQVKTSGQDGKKPSDGTSPKVPVSSGGFIPRGDSSEI